MLKKSFLLSTFFLLTIASKAQLPEFNLKSAILNKQQNYVVYLTAIWCKPCMDGLPDIVDSFRNTPNYKLIIWFERIHLDDSPDLCNRLKKKFGDSLFYFFPAAYYPKNKRLISINPQNKVLRQIMVDINTSAKLNLKWNDMNWGKLILINKDTTIVAKSLKKEEQIQEIKVLLKQPN